MTRRPKFIICINGLVLGGKEKSWEEKRHYIIERIKKSRTINGKAFAICLGKQEFSKFNNSQASLFIIYVYNYKNFSPTSYQDFFSVGSTSARYFLLTPCKLSCYSIYIYIYIYIYIISLVCNRKGASN